ncbi:hypothetical protein KKF91_16530 [Myxococcota bacterium]|nr:hypothetical protein [Myxococcota bacterium]
MRTVYIAGLLALSCADPPQDEADIYLSAPARDTGGLPTILEAGIAGGGGAGGGVMVDTDGGAGGATWWCHPAAVEDCDNDYDDNCDGRVNEGCGCLAPERPCYAGDPRELEAPNAACRAGKQYCYIEFYADCQDQIGPSPEICDGLDNDCNGLIDDLASGCGDNSPPEARCPPHQDGLPLSTFMLHGGYQDADGDAMASATWRVLQAPPGSTAAPQPSDELSSALFVDLQGEYTLELEVRDEHGALGRCQTRVTATGHSDDLRVELVWNVGMSGDPSDMDLHLKRSPTARWFDDATGDDCFYRNCRVCQADEQGMSAAEMEAACRAELAEYNRDPNTSPPPQLAWTAPLNEDDPRLDLDDIEGNGPENINIRAPSPGVYRLGVHYYWDDGVGDGTASLRIFCKGELVEEIPPTLLSTHGEHGTDGTDFWEIADIRWEAGGCRVDLLGTRACPRICTRGEAEAGGCPEGRSRGVRCP